VARIRALSSLRSRSAGRFCLGSRQFGPLEPSRMSFAPAGAGEDFNANRIPRLTRWAKFFRPSGPGVVAQALAACGSFLVIKTAGRKGPRYKTWHAICAQRVAYIAKNATYVPPVQTLKARICATSLRTSREPRCVECRPKQARACNGRYDRKS